ncbi:MAG: hypothetical protein ACYSWW_08710 [Planctomycetota bacterium]|jgi:hypothetical protein
MVSKAYRLHVVVDAHYGERIRDLPAGEPAWVVDSPTNHPVIVSIWKNRPELNQLTGITSFKLDTDADPADWLVGELSTVDLHHGEYSHNPPYLVLNVIGVEWSEKIQKELSRFGFDDHQDTPQGFVTSLRRVGLAPP